MVFRFALVTLLLASVAAFQAGSPAFVRPKVATAPLTTRFIQIISDEETEAILQSASDCAEGECSLDDVSELIYDLNEQQALLQDRLEKVMNMIAHLQHINEKEERKTDEVRAFVKDMLSVFNQDKPFFTPSGFSGDIGKGTMTAYDVLPPKKWKPDTK